MVLYLLPTISALYVYPIGGACDCGTSGRVLELLRGRAVIFGSADYCEFSGRVSIAVSNSAAGSPQFRISFYISSSDFVEVDPEGTLGCIVSDYAANNSTSKQRWGICVDDFTQIVVDKPGRFPFDESIYDERLLASLSSEELGALNGCMARSFGKNTDCSVSSLLLIGDSGAGCTTVMRQIAQACDGRVCSVTCGGLYSSTSGTSRDAGKRIIKRAILEALVEPSLKCQRRKVIILLEDLQFFGAGAGVAGDMNAGIVEGLIEMMCSLKEVATRSSDSILGRVLVVGCCNREDQLSPDLLELFLEVIRLSPPSAQIRKNVLMDEWLAYHRNSSTALAKPTHEIAAIADSLAGIELIPLLAQASSIVSNKFNCHRDSLSVVSNSLRDPFETVAGHAAVKRSLIEVIVWPRRYNHVYHSFHKLKAQIGEISPDGSIGGPLGLSTGVLLAGPPGTGKTLLPRALSEELRCPLIVVRLSDIVRGEIGASEKRVRDVFREAKRAAPAVIFIDEFQALFAARDSVDGVNSSGSTLSAALAGCFDEIALWNRHAGADALTTVIAATNEPWAVDTSFLRPGRLDRCLLVGPLDKEGRAQLIERILLERNINNAVVISKGSPLTGLQMASIAAMVAQRTDKFSGADITILCCRAFQIATQCDISRIRDDSKNGFMLNAACVTVMCEAFEAALAMTSASTSEEDLQEYDDWLSQFPFLAVLADAKTHF